MSKKFKLSKQVSEKWTDRALYSSSIDKDKAIELVELLYTKSGLKVPPIVFTDSPVENQKKLKELKEKRGEKYEYVSPYELLSECSTFASYDFLDKLGLTKNQDDFVKYKNLVFEAGLWEIIAMDEVAIVCGCPTRVLRDENGDLHFDNGPALTWNGLSLYFLHGVEFTEEEYNKVISRNLTLEDIEKFPNADQKAVATSFLPARVLLDRANAVLIHTGIEGTRLFKVENFEGTGETQYAMVMNCPSTGREFLEWVEPEVGKLGDADLAQASCWRDEKGNPLSLEDWLTSDHA